MAELISTVAAIKATALLITNWSGAKLFEGISGSSRSAISSRLKIGKLPKNHDIEKAILKAHYNSIIFIIDSAFSEEYLISFDPPVNTAKAWFEKKIRKIDKIVQSIPESDLTIQWQEIIPMTLSDDINHVPNSVIEDAISDLINIATFTEVQRTDEQKQALRSIAHDNNKGWVTIFAGFLRNEIKTNSEFRDIYAAYALDGNRRLLNDQCKL